MIAYWLLIMAINISSATTDVNGTTYSWVTVCLAQSAVILAQFAILRWGGFF
jgi:hypothetical protein